MIDRRPLATLVAFAISSILFASIAAAQSEAERARALFHEARALAAAGDYTSACPKLEESQRLDPGIGTQFNLADCYEHTGRPGSAWRLFESVATAAHLAGKTERENAARARAAALAPNVPSLVVRASPDVSLRIDGHAATADERVFVDPGQHTIEAEAPGKKPWRVSRNLALGAREDVEVPALEPILVSVPPPPVATARWPVTRTVGVVTASVGVVTLGVAGGFGLRALVHRNDLDDVCPSYPGCTTGRLDEARTLDSDGREAATIATIAAIAGGVVLAAGVFLVLLRGPEMRTGRSGPWRAFGVAF